MSTSKPASSSSASTPTDESVTRATEHVVTHLKHLGVRLNGHETGDELARLLDAVEQFEVSVERAGADLMMDEPVTGASKASEPDDRLFVLPSRGEHESVSDFIGRLAEATVHAQHGHRRSRR